MYRYIYIFLRGVFISFSWKVPTWISPLHSLPISVSHVYAICLGTSERNLCDLCGKKVRKSTFFYAFLHSLLLPPLDECFKEMCACQAELSPGQGEERWLSFAKSAVFSSLAWWWWGGGEEGGMACHFTLSLPGLSPCHSALAMNLKRVWP